MKFGAIIEARMTSTRLPGKILYEAAGKSFLQHLINRLKKVKQINKIIIATTLNSEDNILRSIAKKNKVFLFRGSENDVLSRVIGASKKFNVKNIVNITSDCPIIDIDIISQIIETFRSFYFLVSNFIDTLITYHLCISDPVSHDKKVI